MRWLFAPILLVAACASAKVQGGNNEIDANNNGDDAAPPVDTPPPVDNPPPVDAPPDAPPQPVQATLLEPTTATVLAGNSVNCNNFQQAGGAGTAENHYFRVYTLADFGVTKDFTVSQVTFAVEQASGAAQTATVKVGTYSGVVNAGTTTLDATKITNLNQATANIPIGATNVVTPITATIPAGSQIIIEIASADGTMTSPQHALFIGSNTSGQKKPSFITAPTCNVNAISSFAQIGFAQVQLIISVTGTHLP